LNDLNSYFAALFQTGNFGSWLRRWRFRIGRLSNRINAELQGTDILLKNP